MRGKSTIVMNGRRYDAMTGVPTDSIRSAHVPQRPARRVMSDVIPQRRPQQPIAQPVPVQSRATHISDTPKQREHTPARNIHAATQKSQTLHRGPLKKPEIKHAGETKRQRAIVAKSPHISKFGPSMKVERSNKRPQRSIEPEQAAIVHPIAEKALSKKREATAKQTAQQAAISSRAIKEQLIKEQLDNVDTNRKLKDYKQPKKRSKKARFTSVFATATAVLILAGYFTYLNMPGLSIRVAAVQSGINASLPDYRPDGYAFNGPVTFSEGQVALQFKSNGGPQEYSITQKGSDWDSQAVLDNYIIEDSNGDYSIHSTRGLTVYTYKDKAVWVNRGVMHEMNYESAPLSVEQIERIAASM